MVRPEGELVRRGLRALLGGPEVALGAPALQADEALEARVEGFLAYARSAGLDPRRQVLALERRGDAELIAGMCLWVPAPGRSAMLFGPALSGEEPQAAATIAAIVAALDDARQAGVMLVQAIMELSDAAGQAVFSAAGLRRLATLTYMQRKSPAKPPDFALPADLTLEAYGAATHGLFLEAIAGSYVRTLDCPGLSGMRRVEDVLEGHKSVGVFDPGLWSVLVCRGRPVGCLLLAEIAARSALELVYLGLAPHVRGRGLGRVLMQRVLSEAARRGLELATLAVDAANTPAVRLYQRCGYTSVAQRAALVLALSSPNAAQRCVRRVAEGDPAAQETPGTGAPPEAPPDTTGGG